MTDQTNPGIPINAIAATLMSSSYERPEQLLVASGKAPLGYVSRLPGRSPVGPQLKWKGGGLAVLVALGGGGRHHENSLRTRHPAWVSSSCGARTLELTGAPADGFSLSLAEVPDPRVGVAAGVSGHQKLRS